MRIPCIEMFFPNINDAFESNMKDSSDDQTRSIFQSWMLTLKI